MEDVSIDSFKNALRKILTLILLPVVNRPIKDRKEESFFPLG